MFGAVGWIVVKELRETVRDPHVLLFLVFPIAAYPAILWGTLQIAMADAGWRETQSWTIAAEGPERLVDALADGNNRVPYPADEAAIDEALRDGTLDLAVHTDTENDGLRWVALLKYDSGRPRSSAALHQAVERMRALRKERVKERAAERGLGEEDLEPLVWTAEIRGGAHAVMNWVATILVAFLLPTSLLMSGLYPAIDIVVGERERQTIETTMVSATPRLALAAGRLVTVLVFMGVGAAANLIGITLTASTLAIQLTAEAGAAWIPPLTAWLALPALAGTAVFGAGFMLIALLPARTFKEGEMFGSVVLGVLLGPLAAAVPPVLTGEAGGVAVWIPMANTSVALMSALDGSCDPLALTVPVVVNGGLGVLFVWIAARIAASEDWLYGDRLPRWLAWTRRASR